MGNSLREQQSAIGAVFESDTTTVPVSFGNDDVAYDAANSRVAVCDRSHWGRIRVTDADRIRFLHNQTTHQIQLLKPGEGCDTVFVTSTGRTLDLATAYVDTDSVLLVVSPGQASALIEWMDRYIFFADKVHLADETETTVAFTLLGPESAAVLVQLGVEDLQHAPHGRHQAVTIQGIDAIVAVDSGLSIPGFTIIAAAAAGADLWQVLMAAGAVPLGETVWQRLRVEQGRPAPGAELTEDYNPLEAGLWHTISFDKGCYIGQETIARLNTYQGVKQQLWGLKLDQAIAPGTPVLLNGEKVGVVTSCLDTPTGARGLAYIRTKAGGEGLTVNAGEAIAEVVDLPFTSRGYLAG